MFPTRESEPKEDIENAWFGAEKGKNFKDDDQVMMITVPKQGGKCDPSPSAPPSKRSLIEGRHGEGINGDQYSGTTSREK